ncbi:MAG TPA: hypothetical protein VMU19_11015 [Bryobacteraceae bacterium]|nr:hypothetical protein [Bryobacteraceae bacterium]
MEKQRDKAARRAARKLAAASAPDGESFEIAEPEEFAPRDPEPATE